MDREGSGFAFIYEKLTRINIVKLKASIFNDPYIRELMKNPMFNEVRNEAKMSTWQSLKSVVSNF